MSQDHVKQDLASRNRRVDLDKLPPERVDELSAQIGQKIGQELNVAAEKIKKMLAVYGLDMTISYVLFPMGQNPVELFAKQQAEKAAQAAAKPARKPRTKRASKQ